MLSQGKGALDLWSLEGQTFLCGNSDKITSLGGHPYCKYVKEDE